MSDTSVVVNLLGVGEGGELSRSADALRILLGLEFGSPVQAFRLKESFPGATPFDCLMTLLEQCRNNGVEQITVLTDICEAAWQNLRIEVLRAYPDTTLTRIDPQGTAYYYW